MKKSRVRAVIDIGSHSMRLHVGEVVRKGVVKPLENLWVPVAVGKDTFTMGYVTQGTILDMIRIIRNFKEVMEGFGGCAVRAVATTGVREAANAMTVVERIYITTGIRVELIDPVAEAQILYHGLSSLFRDRYGFLTRNVLVFSLGAGNTQLIYQSGGRVRFTDTRNQGTLRLTRDLDLSEDSLRMMLEKVSDDFYKEVTHYHQIGGVDRLIAVNDDVVKLVRKIVPDKKAKKIYRLTAAEFEKIAGEAESPGRDGFRQKYGLNENISETTRFALLVTARLFRMSGARQICFPEVNTPSSLLNILSLYGDDIYPALTDWFRKQIISSAKAIGEKYKYDAQRSGRVRMLSCMLFDQLKDEYGFSDQERLYLEVAALLHNIGYFVCSKAHHKHTALLIASSDILGLSRAERRIISQIARYHRRALPKLSHEEYRGLSEEERLIVYRMAALLRLADGLCAAPSVAVSELRLKTGEESCLLEVRIEGKHYEFLDVLRLFAGRKSDLFRNFFGMSIHVERMRN